MTEVEEQQLVKHIISVTRKAMRKEFKKEYNVEHRGGDVFAVRSDLGTLSVRETFYAKGIIEGATLSFKAAQRAGMRPKS